MSLYTSLTFRPSSLSTALCSYYPFDECGRSRISNLVSSRGAYVPYEIDFSEQKIIQKLLFIIYIILLHKNIQKTVITVHIIKYSEVCDSLFLIFCVRKFTKQSCMHTPTLHFTHSNVALSTFLVLFFNVSTHKEFAKWHPCLPWHESGAEEVACAVRQLLGESRSLLVHIL